jgi:RNA polymerase sigma factor (sigma-70 family)
VKEKYGVHCASSLVCFVVRKNIKFNLTDDLNILLKGCVKYDRRCQEKLYQRFYPDLFALCNKFFDDEHDIITALNNGMMNAFNNIKQYDAAKGTLQGWVYTVVRNAKKKEMVYQEMMLDMKVEASINPLKDESEEFVISFLTSLTTTTRAVFNLFYIEGYLIKEIAHSLEMKEGTVKWHLNEGRNKLKLIYNNNINTQVYAR